MLPQCTIKLIDKFQQLDRVHFLTRLLGNVFPISR